MFHRNKFSRPLHPKIARGRPAFDALLEAIRRTGDPSLSAKMMGMPKDDFEYWKERHPEEIDAAVIEGDSNRIDTALTLLETASKTAILLEDVQSMLAVVKIIAPELTVYPVEAQRAKARQDYSSPMVALNIGEGMNQLGSKLQNVLRSQIDSSASLPDKEAQ